jgi:hypothetical protein
MAKRSLPLLSDPKAKDILKRLCKDHGITIALLSQLIEIQRENLGRARQVGITADFSAAIADFLDSAGGNG